MATLLEQVLKRVEQQERIDRMLAEKERRRQILINKKMYINDVSETRTTESGEIKVKKTGIL